MKYVYLVVTVSIYPYDVELDSSLRTFSPCWRQYRGLGWSLTWTQTWLSHHHQDIIIMCFCWTWGTRACSPHACCCRCRTPQKWQRKQAAGSLQFFPLISSEPRNDKIPDIARYYKCRGRRQGMVQWTRARRLRHQRSSMQPLASRGKIGRLTISRY